ncbi:MAG: DNA repair protein RecN [Alkaliphilus sp.]|nr:DNA repair protein RecN [Alkaliphilus sp. AH-315-G20]PHS36523.1 MAG: DNA repair protein RecN [Alkaliphilus sp.]
MLLELKVKNFALIDELSMQFSEGLNILSGETGAGKSIIIDAVNMAIGERADREFVRSGCNKCTVQAVFRVSKNSVILERTDELGIEKNEEDIIILMREIYSNGRSVCRINGIIVTRGALKSVSEKLIDIHGQHNHQSLLNQNSHIDILDSFGGKSIQEQASKVASKYATLALLKKQLNEISVDEKERMRKIDMLKFQAREIDESNLTIKEEEDLNSQKKLVINAEKIYSALANSYEKLADSDLNLAILDNLAFITQNLGDVKTFDSELKKFYDSFEEVQFKLQDLAWEIREYKEQVEFDPNIIDEIEERLDIISRLKRKYGISVKEILEYRKKIVNELEDLINSDAKIDKLKEEVEITEKELEKLSVSLSETRKFVSLTLNKSLMKILEELNMKKVSFSISIKQLKSENLKYKLTSRGIDTVTFLISTNVGEPLKPLSKVASGGEMSRIMLALKTILADTDKIACLIFDEIDTGVSGRTAQIVGEKLYQISRNHQVVCITHLPQIACLADSHFLIEKITNDTATNTKIDKLNKNKIILEIGRLLGGKLTEITLKHAKEMIDQASSKKR